MRLGTLCSVLVPLAFLGMTLDTLSAAPEKTHFSFDDSSYQNMPLAARLLSSDYVNLPSRSRARAIRVIDSRRLFELTEPHRVDVVKKSIAEGNPVLLTLRATGSALQAKGVGQPLDRYKRSPCVTGPCGPVVTIVGYDDSQHGGAFEVMKVPRSRKGKHSFAWLSYEDFKNFGQYAVELINKQKRPGGLFALKGAVRFEDLSGRPMATTHSKNVFMMKHPYPSGTRFRIVIRTIGPTYVYAFTADLAGSGQRLFPQGDGISAYLGYTESSVMLPDEHRHFRLDNGGGTDYFAFLYSTKALNLPGIVQHMDTGVTNFVNQLREALGSEVISSQHRHGDEIRFAAHSRHEGVVAIVVELRRARNL